MKLKYILGLLLLTVACATCPRGAKETEQACKKESCPINHEHH